MPKSSKRRGRSSLVFEKYNYLLLLVGLLLVVVGFTAMYLENQFQGFISLTVAPIVILAGYGVVIYGVLWRPDDEPEPEE